MKLVSFGTVAIQKLRRITLDNRLLQNLGVGEGEKVALFFDPKMEAIIITKPSSSNPDGDNNSKVSRNENRAGGIRQ